MLRLQKMRKDLKKKKENLRTLLPKPCVNRMDTSLWIVLWLAPLSLWGAGQPHPQSYAWCSLCFTLGAEVLLSNGDSSSSHNCCSYRTDNRVELESEILIFQLLPSGEGE